jgi:predicted ArsR family transcriptional regulator
VSSDNSNQILYTLKSRGPLGTSTLARVLGITEVGVRQHLARLHSDDLVAFDDQAGEVGRPKRMWRLTAKGHSRFPDTHGDLTVSLIQSIRSVFGEAGLDRLIDTRQQAMVANYRLALEHYPNLGDRVSVLARLRTVEGYMAECELQSDGSFLLIENHCPICAAAKTCQGFCRSELELFQAAFGADTSVTRQEHLLSEGRRCVYRIAGPRCGEDQAGDQGPDRQPMSAAVTATRRTPSRRRPAPDASPRRTTARGGRGASAAHRGRSRPGAGSRSPT